MTVYERIKILRKSKNMSQDELAKKAGYTERSSISRIEHGDVDLPQSKLELIAKALGTTPDYLMGYSSNVEMVAKVDMIDKNREQLLDKIRDFDDFDIARLIAYADFIKHDK